MRKLVFGATLSMLVFQASPVFAQAEVATADPVWPKTREARMYVEHERMVAFEEAQADVSFLEYCSASGLEPNCLEGRLEILNGD